MFELNENETPTYESLWDTPKKCLEENLQL